MTKRIIGCKICTLQFDIGEVQHGSIVPAETTNWSKNWLRFVLLTLYSVSIFTLRMAFSFCLGILSLL